MLTPPPRCPALQGGAVLQDAAPTTAEEYLVVNVSLVFLVTASAPAFFLSFVVQCIVLCDKVGRTQGVDLRLTFV